MSERLFLALWPPAGVLAELADALPIGPALRWQAPGRWHVTLAFLGDRDPAAQLRRLARFAASPPAPLRLSGAGTFGPVLWVGVDTSPWLASLARGLHEHFDVRERRFQAHVTVARSRDAVGRRELRRAVAALASFDSTPWLPEEFTLVRSTVGPDAAYEVIGHCPLPPA